MKIDNAAPQGPVLVSAIASGSNIAVEWQPISDTDVVGVLLYKGNAINIELPAFIEAVITKTEPGIKGDTASGSTKPATIETGAVVQVPLFVKEGEKIRVDTRTGEYVERVSK